MKLAFTEKWKSTTARNQSNSGASQSFLEVAKAFDIGVVTISCKPLCCHLLRDNLTLL